MKALKKMPRYDDDYDYEEEKTTKKKKEKPRRPTKNQSLDDYQIDDYVDRSR